eukprot:TRINITY_DN14489_c1_g1_i37.p1 TRINITY_DN14489_c1_g1~~TRINITY_DN14489_c1_g1_i37.p1  ORF type:complete len:164 (+),score=17.21 TRINITY_DN14489_c1_g1_i37:502-993(+)
MVLVIVSLSFFENCGFKCPERKSPADFLHEVISRKDQAQYWFHPDRPYHHVSVEQFAESFKVHHLGQKLLEELSQPLSLLRSCKCALSFSKYSLCRKQLFRACISREWLLVKRNLFVYVFKSVQVDIRSQQKNHCYNFFHLTNCTFFSFSFFVCSSFSLDSSP